MANAVSSVLSFALMVAVVFAVLTGVFTLAGDSAAARSDLSRAAAEAALGSLNAVGAVATPDAGATVLDITLINDGSLDYSQFKEWDVNVNYKNGAGAAAVERIPYAETLADDTWSVAGLYLDAGRTTAERLEPSVLNPQEYLVLRVRLAAGALSGSKGWAVVTPADGVPVSVFFDA